MHRLHPTGSEAPEQPASPSSPPIAVSPPASPSNTRSALPPARRRRLSSNASLLSNVTFARSEQDDADDEESVAAADETSPKRSLNRSRSIQHSAPQPISQRSSRRFSGLSSASISPPNVQSMPIQSTSHQPAMPVSVSIPINTAVSPSSSRSSTMPLFPSPLAQAVHVPPEIEHEDDDVELSWSGLDSPTIVTSSLPPTSSTGGIGIGLDLGARRRSSAGLRLARKDSASHKHTPTPPLALGSPLRREARETLTLDIPQDDEDEVSPTSAKTPTAQTAFPIMSEATSPTPRPGARTANVLSSSLPTGSPSPSTSPTRRRPPSPVVMRRHVRSASNSISKSGPLSRASSISQPSPDSPTGSQPSPSSPASASSAPATSGHARTYSGASHHERRLSISAQRAAQVFPSPPVLSSSPVIRTAPRSALTASLATPVMQTPPLVAVKPPAESIKLQRVPTSVRLAQDLHTVVSAVERKNSPEDPDFRNALPIPPTPSATRNPSPEFSSNSGDTSPAPTPHASLRPPEASLSSPFASTSVGAGTGAGLEKQESAFSNLFALSKPSFPLGARRRSDFRRTQTDVGIGNLFGEGHTGRSASMSINTSSSPLSASFLPASASPTEPNTFRVPSGKHRESVTGVPFAGSANSTRTNKFRTSMMPGSTAGNVTTEDYARRLQDSRASKLRKWGTPSTPAKAKARLSIPDFTRAPSFRESLDSDLEMPGGGFLDVVDESADSGHSQAASLKQAVNLSEEKPREIEWVDWLDEYNKMKEAKMLAEKQKLEAERQKNESARLAALHTSHSRESNPFEFGSSADNRSQASLIDNGPSSSWSQTSMPSPTIQKRKKNINLVGKIDAWWNAVRGSFGHTPSHTHVASFSTGLTPLPESTTSRTPMYPVSEEARMGGGRPSAHLQRGQTEPYKLSPPLPLRATSAHTFAETSSQDYSSSATALGPAAHISAYSMKPPERPPFEKRKSSNPSDTSDPSSTDISGSKRRNPQLSLRLDSRFKQPMSFLSGSIPMGTSDSSASGSGHGINQYFSTSPANPLARLSTSSRGLTPGKPPIWDRTPGQVMPLSTSIHNATRSDSGSSPAEPTLVEPSSVPDFSMTSIRQHIHHRLNVAKDSCDRELRKIVNGITTYVEAEMRKEQIAAAEMASLRSGEESELDFATAESDAAGNEAEDEADFKTADEGERNIHSVPLSSSQSSSAPLSRKHSHTGSELGVPDLGTESRRASLSIPSSSRNSPISTPSLGSAVERRASAATVLASVPQSQSMGRAVSSSSDRSGSPVRQKSIKQRYPGLALRSGDLATQLEKRLSVARSPIPSDSVTSSRSTSRSRSPMPPSMSRHASADWGSPAPSKFTTESSDFINILQEIISAASEILDTPVSALTAKPSMCRDFVARVQALGRAWDDHPDWPCRNWYVQLLLAVAGLSRVTDWWEAERGFWNFGNAPGETKEDEDTEPIMFVAKPTPEEDARAGRTRAASVMFGSTAQPELSVGALGIDIGKESAEVSPTSPLSVTIPPATTAALADAEQLRTAVEQVRSATILLELSIDGEYFQYLSPVWRDVVGLEPSECLGQPIANLLFPADVSVFAEAAKQLERDDSHTVEVRFRLRVFQDADSGPEHEEEQVGVYEAMEGKGMLMHDGLSGQPTHTMWIIRPAADEQSTEQYGARFGLPQHQRSLSDPVTPFPFLDSFSVAPVLCHICERQIPAWFFEKHNETCNDTHRLERDISNCNDNLHDVSDAVKELLNALQHDVDTKTTSDVAYHDLVLRGSPSYEEHSPTSSDSPLPPSTTVREQQVTICEDFKHAINQASKISTPSLADDLPTDTPVEDQRLLSPNSESRLSWLLDWKRPNTDEPALIALASDVADLIRAKISAVNRLRNTLLYTERIRQEWERKAQAVVAARSPRLSPTSELPPVTYSQSMHSATSTSNSLHPPGTGSPFPFAPSPIISPQTGIPTSDLTLSHRPVLPHSISHLDIGHISPPMSPHISPNESTFGIRTTSGSSHTSPMTSFAPLSPRLPSGGPASKQKGPSIKDYEIIKPISKGAFGSVYLAKKKNTGDYYAVKVLKKSDMISKNQVTNVKAERKIMMTQADSDFAVKLYYTFQSKDYLFLVMEYLNGGDCASLIKVMGCLDEDWTRSYVAEIVLGLEYLHGRGIVHRDLKPDNLLIDSNGHLRLTDFGLSRFGLMGRQARAVPQTRPSRRRKPGSRTASQNTTPDAQLHHRQSYFPNLPGDDSDAMSESSGTESLVKTRYSAATDSPAISFMSGAVSVTTPASQKPATVAGTVDYISYESVLGLGVGEGVDWWALGVITFEFLVSVPPFHAPTPEQVFENILSRKIDWHEDMVQLSDEARDFIERLLTLDPKKRLGANGADEVKKHPFLHGIDWHNVRSSEASFVPQVENIESTDYFDTRGAVPNQFDDDALAAAEGPPSRLIPPSLTRSPSSTGRTAPVNIESVLREKAEADDFGTFNFKNLDVLKQQNDLLIRQLKSDAVLPSPLEGGKFFGNLGRGNLKPKGGSLSDHRHASGSRSPSLSIASSSSSHIRRPSEIPAVSRVRHEDDPVGEAGEEGGRRYSLPVRLRSQSVSDIPPIPDLPESPGDQLSTPQFADTTTLSPPATDALPTPSTAIPSAITEAQPSPKSEKPIDCLIAEDNPISAKMLETILTRLGCRCVTVVNGEEAVRCSMGEIVFDVIWMDIEMPVLGGEAAARMIKSVNNYNQTTPIVAATSYSSQDLTKTTENGTVFDAILSKPVSKADILQVFSKLGFVARTKSDPKPSIPLTKQLSKP